MGLKRADAERVAVAVNIVSAAVWSLDKLDYRLCFWPERPCWFPVLSGSAGRKPASGQNEFGREESVFRLRNIRIRQPAAVSPSACKTELQTAPGVEAAAIADAVPLSGNSSRSPYARADGNPVPVNQRQLGLTRSVSPGYFRTLGISLLSGRDFTEQDKVDSRLVVILSNSTAKNFFRTKIRSAIRFFSAPTTVTGFRRK